MRGQGVGVVSGEWEMCVRYNGIRHKMYISPMRVHFYILPFTNFNL